MSNFNFGISNDTKVEATSSNYFKPYTVNKINKIEAKLVDGTKKDGEPWKAMDLTFTGPEGSIRERYFMPLDPDKGTERSKSLKGTVYPSAYEKLKQLIIHILGIYAPKQFEKLKTYSTKCKTMDQLIDGFIKLLNAAESHETNIKVVGRTTDGKVYAALPSPCGVEKDKDGNYTENIYPINIISDDEKKLSFNNFEVQQANKLKNATPTNMDDIATAVDTAEDDMDISNIDVNDLDEVGDLSI